MVSGNDHTQEGKVTSLGGKETSPHNDWHQSYIVRYRCSQAELLDPNARSVPGPLIIAHSLGYVHTWQICA